MLSQTVDDDIVLMGADTLELANGLREQAVLHGELNDQDVRLIEYEPRRIIEVIER